MNPSGFCGTCRKALPLSRAGLPVRWRAVLPGKATPGFGPDARNWLAAGSLVSLARRTILRNGPSPPWRRSADPANRRGVGSTSVGPGRSPHGTGGAASCGSVVAPGGKRPTRSARELKAFRRAQHPALWRFSAQSAPLGTGDAEPRRGFRMRGAWPAPRGVRSVVSAARCASFPGLAHLTPRFLTTPLRQARRPRRWKYPPAGDRHRGHDPRRGISTQ